MDDLVENLDVMIEGQDKAVNISDIDLLESNILSSFNPNPNPPTHPLQSDTASTLSPVSDSGGTTVKIKTKEERTKEIAKEEFIKEKLHEKFLASETEDEAYVVVTTRDDIDSFRRLEVNIESCNITKRIELHGDKYKLCKYQLEDGTFTEVLIPEKRVGIFEVPSPIKNENVDDLNSEMDFTNPEKRKQKSLELFGISYYTLDTYLNKDKYMPGKLNALENAAVRLFGMSYNDVKNDSVSEIRNAFEKAKLDLVAAEERMGMVDEANEKLEIAKEEYRRS